MCDVCSFQQRLHKANARLLHGKYFILSALDSAVRDL